MQSLVEMPSQDMELIHQTMVYERAHLSENTINTYASLWKGFESWCTSRNIVAFPTTVEAVCLYLSDIAYDKSINSISSIIAAIEYRHRQNGAEIIGNKERIQNVRKGIRRLHIEKRMLRRAKALSTIDLAILGKINSLLLVDYRDKAVIALAFFAALRRSEVVALDREHVEISQEGAKITLMQTKTSLNPVIVSIGRAHNKEICPVAALEAWIEKSKITSGPLFKAVTKNNTIRSGRLSGQSVALIIRARFGNEYGGHSGRRGLITEEARKGISPYQIAKHSRHKDFNVMIGYVEQEQAFETSSTKLLGV